MIFQETKLKDAYIINLEKREDERGFFARFFCVNEYEKLGLNNKIVQINNSFSKDKATLRGIHLQLSPKEETKIVRCIKGAFFDVIVDLRKNSPTFKQWFGIELSQDNRTMLYVPIGFGHSFLTLTNDTEALYLVTEFYSPQHEKGFRWNDPIFNIKWPSEPMIISDKDKNYPDFSIDDF